MQPCNLSLSQIKLETVNWGLFPDNVSWCTPTGAGTFSHFITFQPQRTTLSPEDARKVVARLLCHVILSRLPDEALTELCESLADLYFFYKRPPIPAKLPEIIAYPAKMGESVTRAPINLEDE